MPLLQPTSQFDYCHSVCVAQELVAESQISSGPAMMFATLDYEGCCVKNKTEKIATE